MKSVEPRADQYRPDIDGLRAVAVAAVLLCHAKLGFTGGFVGVDIFFVISGYLITGRIVNEHCKGGFSLLDFWERRTRRLFPPLFVVLIATLIVGWFVLWPDAYRALAESMLSVCGFSSNFHFWLNTGYFAEAAETKPLLHTWSLAVEEQFYFIIPIMVLCAGKSYLMQRNVLRALALVSFFAAVYASYFHRSAAFYLLPTRFWELAVGALLGMHARNPQGRHFKQIPIFPSVSFLAIVLPCLAYDANTRFPGVAAVPPVFAAACVIYQGTDRRVNWLNSMLSTAPFVFVGKISYSLYLWHWPLFAFAHYHALESKAFHVTPTVSIGILLLSGVLATVSYKFIETPVRRNWVLKKRRALFFWSGLGMAGLLASTASILTTGGFDYRLTDTVLLYEKTAQRDITWCQELEAEDVPLGLTRLGNQELHRAELLIWGDSHAMAVLPALDELCKKYNLLGVAATHSSTPPIAGYYVADEFGLSENSLDFSEAIIAYAKREGIPKVLLVSTWNCLKKDVGACDCLCRTLSRLKENGSSVYLLNTVPMYSFDVPRVLVNACYRSDDLDRIGMTSEEYNLQNPFRACMKSVIEADAIVLDPEVAFRRSDTNWIAPFDENGCYYFDSHHLSTYGAMQLMPLFEGIFSNSNDTDSTQSSQP